MAKQAKMDLRLMGLRLGAALVFALCVGGGFFLARYYPNSNQWLNLSLILLLVAAFVVAIWPFPYWCPRCRKRLRMLQERRPSHVYFCPACDIEWNIGSSDAD